jgi:hypothetical protein
MYKENKCMWGCITWCKSYTIIKPCVCMCVYVFPRPKVSNKTSFGATRTFLPLKLWNSELHKLNLYWEKKMGFFRCFFSFIYIITNYGCCCYCCSYNTRVEKEEEVLITEEHKKPANKRNPRNSKLGRRKRLGKIYRFQY